MTKLQLFQTTVNEYKYFLQELPIDYSKAIEGEWSGFVYVAIQTRLMLLRKYTRSGRGNLFLVDVIDEAIESFEEYSSYLTELQSGFQNACSQGINHLLADGTERTLGESIDDTMYGLHLHADEERIERIAQDNNLLRMHCVAIFVSEIEPLVLELYDFLDGMGVESFGKAKHVRAPVIQLESQKPEVRRIEGSPFWSNLVGCDVDEENEMEWMADLGQRYTPEEWQLWKFASKFTSILAQEEFSYDEIKDLVFGPTISDWGDFSEARAYYQAIPTPGITTEIRYNEQHDVAYIHVHPHVEKGFIIGATQIVSDIYVITLIKDRSINEWRVFAFGKSKVDPIIRS